MTRSQQCLLIAFIGWILACVCGFASFQVPAFHDSLAFLAIMCGCFVFVVLVLAMELSQHGRP